MKNYKGEKNNRGLGILDVLQIVLIVLKLTKLIDISWALVFIPLYISFALAIIPFAIAGALIGIAYLIEILPLQILRNKTRRKTKAKAKIYTNNIPNQKNEQMSEFEKMREKYNRDTTQVQAMLLEGADKLDIIAMKSTKEYKQQMKVKNNNEQEIQNFIDYIETNMSMTDTERKKMLLKLKKAYLTHTKNLKPIQYAETVSQKKIGTR